MIKNLTENAIIIVLVLVNLVAAAIMSVGQYMSGADGTATSITMTMAYPLVLALSAGLAHLIGRHKAPRYGAKITSTLLISAIIFGALAIVAILTFPEGVKAIVVPRSLSLALGNTLVALLPKS